MVNRLVKGQEQLRSTQKELKIAQKSIEQLEAKLEEGATQREALEERNERLTQELNTYRMNMAKQFKQLEFERSKWERANAVRRRAKEARQAAAGKAAASSGEGVEEEGTMSRQNRHHVVKEMIGTLARAAHDNRSDASAILASFLNNASISALLDRLLNSEDPQAGVTNSLRIDSLMVDQLVDAVRRAHDPHIIRS